jgi:dihydrofolate reductase
MRKLILKMSMSADGFVGGPNGEIDWIFRSYDAGATDWTMETLWQAGLHAMGHRTYHDMAAHWPTSTEPYAAPMNEIPKVIFSRKGEIKRPDLGLSTTALAEIRHSWENPAVMGRDIVADVARLKAEPGGFILAHGGADFASSLIAAGLVDEFRLLVHPIALGAGLSIFSELARPLDLMLLSSTAFPGGAVANVYRPS